MEMLEFLKQSVIEMDVEKAAELTQKALDEGLDAEEVLNRALVPAMDVVGEEYEQGKRYLPEMFLSAEAMKSAMEVLSPWLGRSRAKLAGVAVIGTVEGDLHDVGKNLVRMMLEGSGFEVHDLGTEIPASQFVEAVKKHDADIVGMSALLTTTMIYMPEVIEVLKGADLRDRVRVMVGGAPLTQEFADGIGADGYAPDAAAAVKLAKRLMTELKAKNAITKPR